MTAYYNEIDPFAAQWLRNLIASGHIAPGDVDERSIEDVRPDDLRGYTQCHFFAGIGVWSLALRRAGWPDDRPAWTGSCPCQPFSAAGKGTGFADERHLWPHFHWLVSQCRPAIVFGEQVASNDGLNWLDLVQADLEGSGYAVGAADLCAAGVGAPHIRQRLYWVGVADTVPAGRSKGWAIAGSGSTAGSRCTGRMGYGQCERLEGYGWNGDNGYQSRRIRAHQDRSASPASATDRLADSYGGKRWKVGGIQSCGELGLHTENRGTLREEHQGARVESERVEQPGPTNGLWRDADWLFCRDGKWRPVEPGTFPLAHGASSRVGRLRAYGNAIVPQVAEVFIRAVSEWVERESQRAGYVADSDDLM